MDIYRYRRANGNASGIRTTDLVGLPRPPEPFIRDDVRQMTLPLALPCPSHPSFVATDTLMLCPLCAREGRARTYQKRREGGLSGALARGEIGRG